MGSSDELITKLRGGSASNYDVISPSSDVAAIDCDGGLCGAARSVEDSRYGQLSPQLTSLPLVRLKAKRVWSAVHVGTRSR